MIHISGFFLIISVSVLKRQSKRQLEEEYSSQTDKSSNEGSV